MFQLPFGYYTISSQFHNCNGWGCMYCRLCGTSCSLSGRLSSVGWYILGGEKDAGYLRLCITIDDWRFSWFFRYLCIADILWNMVQASIGSLYNARVLPKLDNFTNPEQEFLILVFMLILLFIHTLDYFPLIPYGWLFFGIVITPLILDGLDDVLQVLCNTTAVQG